MCGTPYCLSFYVVVGVVDDDDIVVVVFLCVRLLYSFLDLSLNFLQMSKSFLLRLISDLGFSGNIESPTRRQGD